ncbi:MAG: Uma2 family endonuclease [Pirellulales bacterium]
MSTTLPITAAELAQVRGDGRRCELVDGVLRMMSPSGWRHGEAVGNLHGLLWQHIRARRLGKLFGAETGFLLTRNPDTVRAPDVAFVATESFPKDEPEGAFWPGAPDLAVEVVSPSDRASDVKEKIQAWIDAGARAVWVVEPGLRSVTVHRSTGDRTSHVENDELVSDDVVPGFRCTVAEIFAATG